MDFADEMKVSDEISIVVIKHYGRIIFMKDIDCHRIVSIMVDNYSFVEDNTNF